LIKSSYARPLITNYQNIKKLSNNFWLFAIMYQRSWTCAAAPL